MISEAASRFARSEPTIATELLRQLSGFPIDDTILQSTDPFFRPWIVGEKKVIASFEPGRRPTEGEIIVIYGNYPHMYEHIVVITRSNGTRQLLRTWYMTGSNMTVAGTR